MAIEVAFIGAGGVAIPHLETLSKMRGVHVSAICDIARDRVVEIAERFGANPYANYRTLLRKESPDAVYVCVYPAAHQTMELLLAQEGIPFFVEKPVHLDLTICRKVARTAANKGLVTAVGYHFRSLKSTQAARDFLKGKKIAQVHGSWFGGMPGVHWWRQKGLSGGQLVEQTTHLVDLARYLVGEIDSVYALASKGVMTDVKKYSVEDTSVLAVRFNNGVVGAIRSGCIGGVHSRADVSLSIEGRDFTVRIDSEGAEIQAENPSRVESGQTWEEQLANGDKAFIQAVKDNDPSVVYCDYRDGANTLAVTLAGNESMKTGRPVKVRLL